MISIEGELRRENLFFLVSLGIGELNRPHGNFEALPCDKVDEVTCLDLAWEIEGGGEVAICCWLGI